MLALLSIKDMLKSDLTISIRGRYLSGAGEYLLAIENYFVPYRWEPKQLPYDLSTEEELGSLHITFGNPSVRAFEMPLKKATDNKPDQMTVNFLKRPAKTVKSGKDERLHHVD